MKNQEVATSSPTQLLKEFWSQNTTEGRVTAPMELTPDEVAAVAGGPEVGNTSSN
ncbi:hypothetical protein OU995_18100 [Roseateles sp. SL47]|uniref:hypothetical protein n=1 Tax=Roseateles sp. SL47 TaxID=2995138 RepID=UPI00226F2E0C|nr:hypothetical protein [Roseateles sp. SL47]WAC71487.1 hypothetical protein OU995_18100 [Roseateles sp. SL47]